MCGRFLISEEAVEAAETIAPVPQWIQESLRLGDIYPSSESLIIEKKQDRLSSTLMPFGVPSSKSSRRIINARAETVEEKWMFRRAFEHARCAAPCSLFYEWTPEKEKVGFFQPDRTMFLACIAIDDSFVILTRDANSSVRDVHHRMPVILEADEVASWIENREAARGFLRRDTIVLDSTRAQSPRLF